MSVSGKSSVLVAAEGAETGLPSRALLWLFGSFAILLTPQLDRLPIWLLAACLVLAGWRGAAQFGHVRLPGRWLRTGIMLVLVAVYIATVQGVLPWIRRHRFRAGGGAEVA